MTTLHKKYILALSVMVLAGSVMPGAHASARSTHMSGADIVRGMPDTFVRETHREADPAPTTIVCDIIQGASGSGGAISGNGGNGGAAADGGLVRAGSVVSNAHALNMLNAIIVRIGR